MPRLNHFQFTHAIERYAHRRGFRVETVRSLPMLRYAAMRAYYQDVLLGMA